MAPRLASPRRQQPRLASPTLAPPIGPPPGGSRLLPGTSFYGDGSQVQQQQPQHQQEDVTYLPRCTLNLQEENVSLSDFERVAHLGRGSFATVEKVRCSSVA